MTTALARFITGSQSGLVAAATSTSPGWNASRSAGPPITRTTPLAIRSPTALPVASTTPEPVSRKVSISAPRWEATVSGRAWTM